MAVLKCTVCGGELEVNADRSVGVCKFCDSVITIPKEIDRKGNLYNRAVFLRQNNEFDKAMAVYEDILKEDNTDADAHWGLVLSKFGIEYVTDPKTQELVPTCHRGQKAPIVSDPDYLAALEYADAAARDVIEKEARRIQEIQTKILEISRKEPPYDIFICYKESDETGNRTEDSILAQELYFELQKKGYKVFFARKTLESKLGAEYEPIIFAALNSAKVMIVLGTRAEHFNAVWVRNEWSRFMSMAKTEDKIIIPAYRGMSPYELPAELSALQSQDMAKIGFMQDLTDGIERCLRSRRSVAKQTVEKEKQAEVSSERMLENAATYLRLGHFKAAAEAYTTITEKWPENYQGWWGLIVCQTHDFSAIGLKASENTNCRTWFGYVKKLVEPEKLTEMEKVYVEYLQKAAGPEAKEDIRQVTGMVSEYKKKNKDLQNRIGQIDREMREKGKSAVEALQNFDEMIARSKKDLKKREANYTKAKVINTISRVIMVLGAILLLSTAIGLVQGILFGAVGLLLGYLIWHYAGSGRNQMKLLSEGIKKEQEKLLELCETQKRVKSNDDASASRLKKQKETCQKEQTELRQKIAACEAYLSLGEEAIASFWFSERCGAIGVEQACDSQIRECRAAAYTS